MNSNALPSFDDNWNALSLQAQVAVVALVAEQAAIDHGIPGEVSSIDHAWMVVEHVGAADRLITSDAFEAIIGRGDAQTPPGFLAAMQGLIDTPPSDGAARAFLATCDPHSVACALATLHDAVTRGTDLTPPIVLRQEFHRRRG